MLTRDEERALPQMLASLPGGVKLLVVDAQSRDRTREIAAAAGARVVERAWTDFVDARRFALAQVATPWALMLDADERLDEGLRAALIEAQPDRDGFNGYRVRRTTYFCGRPVAAMGWSGEPLLRVFRATGATLEAHPAAGGQAALHERWRVPGAVGELCGNLLHDSYPDVASYRRKFERYTSLEAQGLRSSPPALALATLRAVLRFGWLLGPRGGLRAGWRGAYLSFWSAAYPVVVHLKAARRR